MTTQAQLESHLRQFFRTRPNEELSRVANSKPERFWDSCARWTVTGEGCLICHLTDNSSPENNAFCPGENAYHKYKYTIAGAEQAERDYFSLVQVFIDAPNYKIHHEAQRLAGAILIQLANEVLAERGDMNILDEVEASHVEHEIHQS